MSKFYLPNNMIHFCITLNYVKLKYWKKQNFAHIKLNMVLNNTV